MSPSLLQPLAREHKANTQTERHHEKKQIHQIRHKEVLLKIRRALP
jgi:hypothetical protein